MNRTIFNAIKVEVSKALSDAPLEVLAISEGETVNSETGVVSKFTRLEVEVPRGYAAFSRCRFSVKIPDKRLEITEKELKDAEFSARFKGLEISFIDTKGNVYFRATDCEVKEDI